MIPVFKPSIRRKEMDSVLSALVSDRIGPETQQRELVKELCSLAEAHGGFALREYERAIALALEALGLEEGDGVVLSPLSPVSYYRVMKTYGLVPLLVDVDSHSMCVDAGEAIGRIERDGAKAVIADGPLGFIPPLRELSDSGVPIIEDISSTVGGHTGELACGSYGEVVIIRLEAQDLITSGGGTVVMARKRSGYAKLKQAAEVLPREVFLPDMNAALAKIQIKELDRYFERRKELYSILFSSLRKGRHGAPVQTGEAESVAYSFPVLVDGGIKEVQGYARKKGVETLRGFPDATLGFIDDASEGESRTAENRGAEESREYPNARRFLNSCLLFPLYPRLAKDEVDKIGKVLTTLP